MLLQQNFVKIEPLEAEKLPKMWRAKFTRITLLGSVSDATGSVSDATGSVSDAIGSVSNPTGSISYVTGSV